MTTFAVTQGRCSDDLFGRWWSPCRDRSAGGSEPYRDRNCFGPLKPRSAAMSLLPVGTAGF